MSRRTLSVFLVALAGLGVVYATEVVRAWRMTRDVERLKREISTLRSQTRVLERAADRLRSDPAEIERLAREDLGYVRPGERVLKFPAAPGGPSR
jgi:cell division protein FtsB